MSFVTCDWAGRLGNNMFQAAAVIAYAKKHNIEVHFPYHEYLDYYFDYELQDANKDIIVIKNFYQEPCHAYKEIPYLEAVCLHGYFQSEKYFKDIKDELREYFIQKEYPEVKNYVAIHIRRGDYLNYPDKHPIPDFENYYAKAIKMFSRRKFLIFSDDKEWCESKFTTLRFMFSWKKYPGLNDYEYLQLMTSCSDFIIANSSYSWWGSWLSNNPNKKVICPSYDNWFGPGNFHLYPNDIIPKEWIQIEY